MWHVAPRSQLRLALICCLLPVAKSWAQTENPTVLIVDSPVPYRQFSKVEITGSSIIGKEAKGALPIQVITRQDIERNGHTDLPQLLQKLPVMFNFSEQGGMTGTTQGGPETAAIHGRQSGTLVLLNGRRLPYYGSQTIFGERASVDLNLLPLSAIERIELLTDGASSRYGSDAIAGVVNIITRSSTKGTTVGAQFTRPAGGVAPGRLFSLAWGTGGLEDQGYRLQAHFSAEKQEALLAGERENTRNGAIELNIQGQRWWATKDGNISQSGWPASIRTSSGVIHPVLENTGSCPKDWYTSTRGGSRSCWRNSQDGLTLYPFTEKKQLFVDGELLLDGHWRGFGQVIAGTQEQRSIPTESVAIDYDLGNGTQAMIDTSPVGPVRQSYRNSHYQFTGGLKGDWQGWDMRTSASTGKHRVKRAYTGGLVNSRSGFSRVVLTPEDWGKETPFLSPRILDQYTALLRTSDLELDDGYTQLTAMDVLASKEVAQTDDGPVALGLGLNWRNESVDYTSPFTYRPSFSGKRQNWALHAELQGHLTETQDITLALRHDQYSDFGGVQTGKLGWRWRPQAGLMVRSSLGTGFRAPTLGQMTSVTTDLVSVLDQRTMTTLQVRNSGNPDLQPERSQQATLGVRWEPSARWSMGADFWHLHVRDTFGYFNYEQVLGSNELRGKYISVSGDTTYLNLLNLNLGRSQQQGIDYDLQWREPTRMGRVRVSLRGTRNLHATKQAYEGGGFESELGRYAISTQSVTPKHQLVLAAGLERSDWYAQTSLNYRSGFENTMLVSQSIYGSATAVTTRVPGLWTLDLAGRWQVSRALTLTGSVQNLTNRQPALLYNAHSFFVGADTRMANYYGRTLRLRAEYKF